jgi:ribose transport system substrate-binding protein
MRHSKILIASMLLFIFVFAGILINISPRELKNENKPRVFGATYMTMNNPYFVVLNNSIKEVVEGNGDILISRDPSQDQLKQNQQILDMIEEGVDAIFLNPVDWKTVKPALVACYDANFPCFSYSTIKRHQQLQNFDGVESSVNFPEMPIPLLLF